MNKFRIIRKSFLLLFTLFLFTCTKQVNNTLMSPDGTIKITLLLDESNQAYCQIEKNGSQVFEKIKLGVILEDADFSEGLSLQSISGVGKLTENYTLLHGKQKEIKYIANKSEFHFVNDNGDKMDIVFHVSNDGVAFKYFFPGKSEDIKKIKDEITSFSFANGTTSWIQPMSKAKTGWNKCHPSYEEHYQIETLIDSLPAHEPGWIFPALFKSGNCWISLTESAPDRDYCACRLMHDSLGREFKIGFPEPTEVFTNGILGPESTLPWNTPWRIITIGDNLKVLVESTLGTDLAKPADNKDYSFVKPGRSSWSWVLYKDDSTVYGVQKRFIDYASDMGWEYCLVDADWNEKIGYEKIGELCAYAKRKNVGVVVWYNSAGEWNTTPYEPRGMLLTKEQRQQEFKKLQELGVKGIKVDFFGGDGQSMMNYYQDIFEDAAEFKLMVNCHGSTLPRCWHRTYPNLVSMEAIRGFEFVTFFQSSADIQPGHSTVIPFTRNLFDPMDFTPVCFTEMAHIQRKTSNVFELALSVIFLSGVQHYAEVPEGMAKVPPEIKSLMSEVPVDWDETKFIDGYPGKFFVVARRKGKSWYIAGINGSNEEKKVNLELSFVGSFENTLFVTDGNTNRDFNIAVDALPPAQEITIKPSGGFVYKIDTK